MISNFGSYGKNSDFYFRHSDKFDPNILWYYSTGTLFTANHRLIGIRIPMINLRRSSDRLSYIMEIPLPGRRRLLVNRGPVFMTLICLIIFHQYRYMRLKLSNVNRRYVITRMSKDYVYGILVCKVFDICKGYCRVKTNYVIQHCEAFHSSAYDTKAGHYTIEQYSIGNAE